jgi:ATP-binding cassette subfamily C protein CydC
MDAVTTRKARFGAGQLGRWLKPHKGMAGLGILLSLLATLFAVGLLALSGWFITAAAVAGFAPLTALQFNFFFPSIGVRLLAVFRTLGRYAERLILHDTTFRILKSLRLWLYTRIEPLAPAMMLRRRSGDMLNRMVSDIDVLDSFYVRVLTPFVVFLISALLATGFLWLFAPSIARMVLVFLVLLGIGLPFWSMRRALGAGRRLPGRLTDLRNTALDTVTGMATLQMFNASGRQRRHLKTRDSRLIACQRQLNCKREFTDAIGGLVGGVALVCVLARGLVLVHQGKLTGPLFAMILMTLIAILEVAAPLPAALQFWGQIRKAGQRLAGVTRTPPAVLFESNQQGAPLDSSVALRGVRFAYPGTGEAIFENLELTLNPGEKIGVVGASGCGKSTLAHLLVRFWDPDQGHIRIGGKETSSLSEEVLRRSITLISQNAHLFSSSIRRNLLLADPRANARQMWAALEKAQLAPFVQDLPQGMDTWIGERGHLLSGGQARRLVLARAILHDAPIWILDEPTEGLDVNTEYSLMKDFLLYAQKRTLLLISHRYSVLQTMDRIMLLRAGKLSEIEKDDHF